MRKKDKDNLDFIKAKFDNDCISKPNDLDSRVIDEIDHSKSFKLVKPKFGKPFKAAVSIAACFAVLIVSLTISDIINNEKMIDNTNNKTVSAFSALKTFSSYDELEKTASKITEKAELCFNTVKSSDADALGVDENVAAETSFSDTYKQVDKVDEADSVKTDGKYIYHKSEQGDKIIITEAKGAKTKKISEIDFSDDEKDSVFVIDFFLANNRLIVNCGKHILKKDEYIAYTVTRIYDITNKEKPKKICNYQQSGGYVSSRMIDDVVYIVSDYNYGSNTLKEYIPEATDKYGAQSKLAVQNICCVDNPDSPSYVVLGALDSSTGKNTAQTKAVLGASSDVYCNENNMYITSQSCEYVSEKEDYINPIYSTQIIKATLLDDRIEFVASGKVDGYTDNQFSLDEKDGYLRIATTSNRNGKDTNNLFVLDKDLKVVGKVANFAKNEHIEAVRFIGDTAYVITYEQTDPLFIIDLSNPTNPEITGSVKISGFSTLLVPVDDHTLLGIGFSTDETPNGIATDGIKFALFDISEKSQPKVIDSKELKGYDSDVQFNHKALIVNRDKGYYAIPYYTNLTNNDVFGALTFEVKNGKINITNKFSMDRKDYLYAKRCVYINDFIYVIDTTDNIHPFEV